jgi:uncharacterized membrane protein
VDSAGSAVEAGALAAEARDRVGSEMRTKEFLTKLEHARIVTTIREAESKTSGEIRVFIQRGTLNTDPVIAAQRKFKRLGMHKTLGHNAVLIFVAPRAHKFAVIGDKAIHEKCGEQFWEHIVDGMRVHFRNEQFSHALTEAIEGVGKVLATHFPRTGENANELPDEIIEG